MPELVKQSRPDAIVATGRSDLPNQVNNVLCFPFIFRGALDVRATGITESMKLAAVAAIAELARVELSDTVAAAYGGHAPSFGPDYIIPKPFDPRLILHIAPAVARAAMEAGVARKPIEDFDVYKHELERFVFRSGQLLRPVIEVARKACPRIVYAEGEDERTLRAVQSVVDDKTAHPILVGRGMVIAAKIAALGLRMKPGQDVRIVDFEQDKVLFAQLLAKLPARVGRRGTPPDAAVRQLAKRPTVSAGMLLAAGEADAAICGGTGDWWRHFQYALPIIPRRAGVSRVYALTALILQAGVLFFCDTHVNVDPTAEEVAEMTLLAAEMVHRFGLAPKVALLSHSNFGASNSPSARKMRQALALIRAQDPELEVDGEMHADAALVEQIRAQALPEFDADGDREPADLPEHRFGEYRLQPGEGERRGCDGWADAARVGQAPAYRGAQCHRARDREHLRSGGDGSGARAGEEVRQGKARGRKRFFFEKKNQKTSVPLAVAWGDSRCLTQCP